MLQIIKGEDMYDYIIIGAGITGITLCKKLREKGITNILVLEKNAMPGGLCRTVNCDGHVLDIGGGHFFHTKHQEIFDYVFRYLSEDQFNYYQRVSKIEIEQQTIDYPIESNVWQLPEEKQIEYLISIIRNGEAEGKKEPENYEQWIRWKLGDKICDEYMEPYNVKLWGVEPKQMDIDWLYKIPRVKVQEILKYSLERKQDVNKFPAHIHFYYPKHNGFQSIVDALVQDELKYIVCNEPVTNMQYTNQHWLINGKYESENVINTTPWNDLYDTLGSPVNLKADFDKIQYNKLMVSLYEKKYQHDWHWRYIPDINKSYHREFYIHNFAEDSKEDGIYTETNTSRMHLSNIYENEKPIYSYKTDAAYPIPVIGHTDAIQHILDYYRTMKLFGVGRWGQHEYQNADVSMYEAIKFVDALA